MTGRKQKRRKTKKRSSYMAISAGPGKQHYLGRMNWLLHFINADIDAMSYKDFIGVFYDYLTYLYGDWHGAVAREGTVRSICHDTDINRQQLKKSQRIFREEIERLLSNFASIKGGETIIPIEDEIKVSYSLKPSGNIILSPNAHIFPSTFDSRQHEEIANDDFMHGSESAHFSDFLAFGFVTAIKYFLYTLCERVSVRRLYCCEDCNKYFIKTASKKSSFCRRCLKKRATYKWRDENREVYNIYQDDLRHGIKSTPRQIREELDENT